MCKQLKASKDWCIQNMEIVGTRLRGQMFENKENFWKVMEIIEKIIDLKSLLSYTIVPSSHFYMAESILQFEEKWGGFKSINRINFDTCKGFHECLQNLEL